MPAADRAELADCLELLWPPEEWTCSDTCWTSRLQMRIDEADEARRQHAGEAQTLRGEVSKLKGLIEDLQQDGRKDKDVIIRMESQVEEAGDLRAKVLNFSAELATARQRVEEMRGEKVKQAAAHEKALQELRDKLNDEEVERQRVQSELDVSAARIKVMPGEPSEPLNPNLIAV